MEYTEQVDMFSTVKWFKSCSTLTQKSFQSEGHFYHVVSQQT